MKQWGFYFNQDRCLGCKTCVMACKNWNELRRGDSTVNINVPENFMVKNGKENGKNYTDPKTGGSNFTEYRKYYMKENWRRVEPNEKGGTIITTDNTFETTASRSYISISCNHCTNPACIDACPVCCIFKDDEYGLTIVNNHNCLSCGRCKDACPWSAPQFHSDDFANFSPDNPARPRMTKCTGCLDRIRNNLKPACVAACWNRALDAGPIDELKAKYKDYVISAEGFKQGYIETNGKNTEPNIIFKQKK